MSQRSVTKKQRDALRERMVGSGRTLQAIAQELSRRWGYRPRLAWRYAHGWSQDTAAAVFNQRCDDSGRALMSGSRISAYERWPHAGERPSLRVLRSLAELYGTTLDHLVDEHDLAHLPEPDRLTMLDILNGIESRSTPAQAVVPQMRTEPTTIYGQENTPGSGPGYEYEDSDSEHEVVFMTAHESSEHAQRAERRDIGEATLDQFRADLTRLAHEYLTGDPFPLLREMRRVRTRLHTTLDQRLWPRDTTELYLLLGALNGLMANAAEDLGYASAADELLRAGWAYAAAIDHRPLMGLLRGKSSSVAYWQNRPRQARDLAASGLKYLSNGQGAARLHLMYGQACAKLGDLSEAKQAIEAAHAAAARPHHDEVHDEIGGQFACAPAKRVYLAGNALVEDRGSESDAITALQQATSLFAAEPAEERSYGCEAIAHVNLARVQLRAGELDAVDLSLVLNLPPGRRIDALPKVLTGVRVELADRRYQGDPQASELDERIETFTRQTIVHDLHGLPMAPA